MVEKRNYVYTRKGSKGGLLLGEIVEKDGLEAMEVKRGHKKDYIFKDDLLEAFDGWSK